MTPQNKPKILIALDFFSSGQKVADEGLNIAKLMKANVVLLHVILGPINSDINGHVTVLGFGASPKPVISLIKEDEKATLMETAQQYLDNTKLHFGDVKIETIVKEGNAAESILEVAMEVHADLIIVGSYCQKWFENHLQESIAEKILRFTKVPLCIIPTQSNREYQRRDKKLVE